MSDTYSTSDPDATREALREAKEALVPFSKEAAWWLERNYGAHDSPVEGFEDYQAVMTCGDLFRARATLTKINAILGDSE